MKTYHQIAKNILANLEFVKAAAAGKTVLFKGKEHNSLTFDWPDQNAYSVKEPEYILYTLDTAIADNLEGKTVVHHSETNGRKILGYCSRGVFLDGCCGVVPYERLATSYTFTANNNPVAKLKE